MRAARLAMAFTSATATAVPGAATVTAAFPTAATAATVLAITVAGNSWISSSYKRWPVVSPATVPAFSTKWEQAHAMSHLTDHSDHRGRRGNGLCSSYREAVFSTS